MHEPGIEQHADGRLDSVALDIGRAPSRTAQLAVK